MEPPMKPPVKPPMYSAKKHLLLLAALIATLGLSAALAFYIFTSHAGIIERLKVFLHWQSYAVIVAIIVAGYANGQHMIQNPGGSRIVGYLILLFALLLVDFTIAPAINCPEDDFLFFVVFASYYIARELTIIFYAWTKQKKINRNNL